MAKNLPANAGFIRDMGLIPGWGKSPGGGHGKPPVFLPGASHEQRSLVGCSPWGHTESDVTEMTQHKYTHEAERNFPLDGPSQIKINSCVYSRSLCSEC